MQHAIGLFNPFPPIVLPEFRIDHSASSQSSIRYNNKNRLVIKMEGMRFENGMPCAYAIDNNK
jgi:hypothetical protein